MDFEDIFYPLLILAFLYFGYHLDMADRQLKLECVKQLTPTPYCGKILK